jgi:tetratricopeptide (TPR) repeat protein
VPVSVSAPVIPAQRAAPPRTDPPGRPAAAIPAQLPAAPVAFTGRRTQVEQLDELLDGIRSTSDRAMVLTICGTAGVGKTSLALHWAHQVHRHFPDGQLFVDLGGHAAGSPMRPIEALARFLRALGVPGADVPLDEDEAAALYRSLLAGKRMLMLLDNAHTADQVRPLLPGGRGSAVVVTGRDRLAGLVARDGAHRIVLDVLSQGEGMALLGSVLDDTRIAAEPDAAAELVRACARLPLALRIAAANLLCNPQQTISGYLTDLTADGLAGLEVAGDRDSAVRAAFDLSYQRLEPDDRALFRLLGVLPGPDVTADAAAALSGRTSQWARRALDRLAGAYLLDQRAPDRFTLHDLLRRYAEERAHAGAPPTDRRAALNRLLDWYLQSAQAAAALVCPQMLRLPVPVGSDRQPMTFPDQAHAASWLDAERQNLLAATRHAAAHGPMVVAAALADAMRGFYWLSAHTFDWLTSASAGLAAAETDGDLRWQAAAHQNLGHVQRSLGRHEQAIGHLTRSLELSRQLGWRPGEANAHGGLGISHGHTGRLTTAVEHLARAMAINRELGRRTAEADNLSCLGMVLRQLGRLGEAADHHARARLVCRESGFRVGEAYALNNLGCTHRDLGRLDQALYNVMQAIEAHHAIGDPRGEAMALCAAADVHFDAGRHQQALEYAHACLALAEQTRDRRVQAAVHNTLGNIRLRLDQFSDAAEQHQRALRLARETGNLGEEADALLGLAAVCLAVDEHDGARNCANRALALVRRARLRILEGHATTTLAAIDLAEGNPERAAAQGERALTIHRETGHRLGTVRTLRVLAVAVDRTRGAGAAQAYWEEADALADDLGGVDVQSLLAEPVVPSATRTR